jgi:hypothetical protein
MLNVSNTVSAASLVFLFYSSAGSPARSGERHVVLTNNSPQVIVEIYASDDGAENWQEDLLGSAVLLPGRAVFVDIDDRNGNCRIDIKSVLDNGSHLVNRRVSACPTEGHEVSIR